MSGSPAESTGVVYDAIILAGGRASRLGGTQKAEVEIGGRALLDTVLEAAAGARRIVVVAPDEVRRDRSEVRFTREDPPFGGPVAGIAAGLAALDAPWPPDAAEVADAADAPDAAADAADRPMVLVLACDLPFARHAVQRLDRAATGFLAGTGDAPPAPDGVCLVDSDGREQWLAAIYRHGPLQRSIDALAGAVHGASVRRLVGDLDLRTVVDESTAFDVDTWEDVEAARRRIADSPHDREGGAVNDAQTPATPKHLPADALEPWLTALAEALALDPAEVPIQTVLDVARDVARGVARPAAPLSTFLVGLAAAKQGGDDAAIREASRIATELALGWNGGDAR